MDCSIMTTKCFLFQIIISSINSSRINWAQPRVRIRINTHQQASKSPPNLRTPKIHHRQTLTKRRTPSTLTLSGKWLNNYNNKLTKTLSSKIAFPQSNWKKIKSNYKESKNNSKALTMSKNKHKRPSSKHAHVSTPCLQITRNKMTSLKKLPKRINFLIKIKTSQ